jgi:hypothetical protein
VDEPNDQGDEKDRNKDWNDRGRQGARRSTSDRSR